MESLWKLLYLMEPAPLTLIITAVAVTFGSAYRALMYSKEMERNRDFSEASITLDRSQALMIPIMSSCSLLMMFYLFSSVSQVLTVFTTVASVSSLYFWLSPYTAPIKSQFGLIDPFFSRCCSKPFTRLQGLLLLLCICTVAAWLVSGNWVLNDILGISLCVAFVSHVRLPNIKTCAMLLACLFVYDIFWVFFSERFFGANVMVSVATQQASNPVHTVANSLSLPGLQHITRKLELPVKIVFPRNLFGGGVPSGSVVDYMMLGLGGMALLSGCYTGGLASYLHCDNFTSYLSPTTSVKCLGDAGFFLDAPNITSNHTFRSFYARLVSLQGVEKNLNSNCTRSIYPKQCFFPQYTLNYIKTPFFVLNSAYDVFQFHNILVPSSDDPHGHWNSCKNNPAACNTTQLNILQGFRTEMLSALLKFYKNSTRGGVYINSCFAHCQSESQDTWLAPNSPRVHNKTISQAVGD